MLLEKKSKLLSYILRHNPSKYGVQLEDGGWASSDAVLNALNIGWKELKEIVSTDSKGRYSFSEDYLKIRANQGHSTNINMGFIERKAPDFLYHGTSEQSYESIKFFGICKMSRQFVHLTESVETASSTGKRHGKLVLLKVNCKKMMEDGFVFYCSDNNVWLTDHVPNKYLEAE